MNIIPENWGQLSIPYMPLSFDQEVRQECYSFAVFLSHSQSRINSGSLANISSDEARFLIEDVA